MLIDFDNVTLGIRSDLQHQLRRLLNSEMIRGKVAVQRAYADWRRYPQYIVPLSEASIDLIFAPAFGSNKKNATDIRLAIDALELVFTRPEIGTFILLSGDSDFSSLVLKLKEYGKWVIGVGIRESASDLLVQNCDEYFSYSELTGLTKTDEAEDVRRDPWELVVEAVLRMKDGNDTMRSDRLKQVMQQIDPHFDEKDAGFNRFSKFVLDAGHRGLLTLHKMENGQYEIGIGPDANVPPGTAVTAAPAAAAPPVEKPEKGQRRRPDAASRKGMTLSSAFTTLKAVLIELGAVDDEVTDVERVRSAMMESAGDANDPLFEPDRFMQMLRQADDAELVELAKNRHGDVVSLLPGSVAVIDAEPEAKPAKRKSTKSAKSAKSETAAPSDVEERDAEPKRAKKTKKTKKTTKAKKATKVKSTRTAKKDAPPADAAEPVGAGADDARSAEPPKPPARPAGPRLLRGRGSSRSRKPVVKAAAPEPQPEPATEDRQPVSPRPSSDRAAGRRSVRGRGGSRGRKAPEASPPEAPPTKEPPTSESPAGESSGRTSDRLPARDRGARSADRPAARDQGDKPTDRPRQTRKPSAQKRTTTSRSDAVIQRGAEAAPPPEAEKESGGLFKRMTAALQKALGEETDD